MGGNEIKLTGIGFTGATDVKFGDVSATSFKVVDDKTITAIAPANEKPVGIKIKVVSDKGSSNTIDYTYRIPYRISVASRYFDDHLTVKLNDIKIIDIDGTGPQAGEPSPLILKDFAANDGDKLTFLAVNRWPWACSSGDVILIKPDGSTNLVLPSFYNSNCTDRIGEVARYEYVLPNGPSKSVSIQAPDITDVTIAPAVAGTPTTFTWKLTNPANAALNCFIDFGDGQNKTLDTCTVDGSTQHTYNSAGNYSVKFKVADGPYVSGNIGDPKSGDSNGFQKFYSVKVGSATTPTNPSNPSNPSNSTNPTTPVEPSNPGNPSDSTSTQNLNISSFTAENPSLTKLTRLSWNILNPSNLSYTCEIQISGNPLPKIIENCQNINSADIRILNPSSQDITLKTTDKYNRILEKTIQITPSAVNVTNIDSNSQLGMHIIDIINQSSYKPSDVLYNLGSLSISKIDDMYYIALLESKPKNSEIDYIHNLIVINQDKIGVWERMGIAKKEDRVILNNLITGGSADVLGYSQLTDAQKITALEPALYEPIQMLSQTFKQAQNQAVVQSNALRQNLPL